MAETFWLRIKEQTNTEDVTMGVYYGLPSQDDNTKELRDTSKSTALVLMWDFSLLDASWEDDTAGTMRSRRFLKIMTDSFMVQDVRELARKDALLDSLLVNQVSHD